MTHGRKSGVALRGAAECVDTTYHWILRGDPRETAKTYVQDRDDRETWFSMDYDDRLRFSSLVDPWALLRMAGREHRGEGGRLLPHLGASPFPWWIIALITGYAKGCLQVVNCRRLLLRNSKPEWFDHDRELLGVYEEEDPENSFSYVEEFERGSA